MQTLRTSLAEWVDFDGAEHELGVLLGLFERREWDPGLKWIFWSNNPLGEALSDMLQQLAKIGVLEHDAEESRFRWNPFYQVGVTTKPGTVDGAMQVGPTSEPIQLGGHAICCPRCGLYPCTCHVSAGDPAPYRVRVDGKVSVRGCNGCPLVCLDAYAEEQFQRCGHPAGDFMVVDSSVPGAPLECPLRSGDLRLKWVGEALPDKSL